MTGRILRFIAPLFVFLLFVGIGKVLLSTKPVTPRTPTFAVAPLVRVTTTVNQDLPRKVEGMGSVIPAQQVRLHPQVGGKVTEVAKDLVPGGLIAEGDLLVSIDPRDYELAVVQAEASLAQARYQWKVEQGRKRVAEREWKLLDDAISATPEGRELALRKPQLASARAAVKAAKSGLERASLALERTQLTAPFNAIVQSEGVDIGAVVAPSSTAAVLVGTDVFWAQISIPVNHLSHVRVGDDEGSTVVLRQSTGGEDVIRAGRVVRALGDLDPKGRMARVVVAIPDPLGLQSDAPALRLGAYVEASIDAATLEGVAAIPRASLRADDQVWTITSETTLQTQEVEVVWRDREQVYVQGLPDNTRIVLSDLDAPVDGMKLQIDEADAPTVAEKEGSP